MSQYYSGGQPPYGKPPRRRGGVAAAVLIVILLLAVTVAIEMCIRDRRGGPGGLGRGQRYRRAGYRIGHHWHIGRGLRPQRHGQHRPCLLYTSHVISLRGEMVAPAQNRALSADSLRAQVSKLGGTVFYVDQLDALVDENVYVSAAGINALRREAVSELTARRIAR